MTDGKKLFIEQITRALNELSYAQVKSLAAAATASTAEHQMEQELMTRGWHKSSYTPEFWVGPNGEQFTLQKAWDYLYKHGGSTQELMNSQWFAQTGPYQVNASSHYRHDYDGQRTWYVSGPRNQLICEGCDEYTAKRIATDHNIELDRTSS